MCQEFMEERSANCNLEILKVFAIYLFSSQQFGQQTISLGRILQNLKDVNF